MDPQKVVWTNPWEPMWPLQPDWSQLASCLSSALPRREFQRKISLWISGPEMLCAVGSFPLLLCFSIIQT